MSKAFVFWFIMLLCLLFGGLGFFGVWSHGFAASGFILFILLALLGWAVFGKPIQ